MIKVTSDMRPKNSSNESLSDAPAINTGKVYVEKYGDSSPLIRRMELAKPVVKAIGKQFAEICKANNRVFEKLMQCVPEIMQKAEEDLAEKLSKILEEANASFKINEADWLVFTGVVPPRMTLDNIPEVAAWWRKQAAITGVGNDYQLSTNDEEFVLQIGPLEGDVRRLLERRKTRKTILLPSPLIGDEVLVELCHKSNRVHWIVNGKPTGQVPNGTLTTWSEVLFENIGKGFTPHLMFQERMGAKNEEEYWRSHKQNRSKLKKLIDFVYCKDRGMQLPPKMRKLRP